MISLEMAKRLKDAGLKWEPQNGDWFATGDDEYANIFVISGEQQLVDELGGKQWFFHGHSCVRGDGCFMDETASYCMNMDGFRCDNWKYDVTSAREMLWLPRLDQLLAEIEKTEYRWEITYRGGFYYVILPDRGKKYAVWKGQLDELAAEALLWIYEQERGNA